MSARERRRRLQADRRQSDQVEVTPRKARSSSITKAETSKNPTDNENETETDGQTPKRKPRRITRKSITESQTYDNEAYDGDETIKVEKSQERVTKKQKIRKDHKKPPVKKRSRKSTKPVLSNPVILNGLEDDIVNAEDEENEPKESQADKDFSSDRSQKPLVGFVNATPIIIKSTPTDKYYLELEKRFQIQQKNIYEKREEMERLTQYELEMKLKQREELKYQIRTPRTALKCHKLIRLLVLFVHGLNCGFQFWNAAVINLAFTANVVTDYTNSPIFDIFRSLILPVHCLSYFFIALCIVDIMDR
jgi:hypothetical protein